LDTLRNLQGEGFDTDYLKVTEQGYVDLEVLERSIRPSTIAVSIIAVHNEIGVIQNLKEIGKICKKHKIFFHTDAAQAFGKIPMDAKDWNIDLMSISGHKIYGPKGVGALYVSRKPRVRLQRKIFLPLT
jgi:cysteine desulfurase